MLNMNEWMKLWGLDPKTGLPTLWKLWWPWLDAEQPMFRMQVRIGSFPIPQPVASSRNVLKQAEVIEQPVTQQPALEAKQAPKTAETVKNTPAKTVAKKTAVKKDAAPKVAAKTAASKEVTPVAPAVKTTRAKAAAKPVAQTDAVKTPAVAKLAVEKTVVAKTATTPAATVKKETAAAPKKTIAAVAKNATTAVKTAEPAATASKPIAPAKAVAAEKTVAAKPVVAQAEAVKPVATPVAAPKETTTAAVKPVATASPVISAKTQQQIDQLGAAPNKEALRAAIRAVYAEKGAATAEQWGKWLHQNADVLNTLHLQPMAAAGEIKLEQAPAASVVASKTAE